MDEIVHWKLGSVLTSTIERHAASASKIMGLPSSLLNGLLSGDIASCEKNRSRHARHKERARGKPGIVPAARLAGENSQGSSYLKSRWRL